MNTPQKKTRETFEISLTTDNERKLAYILFDEKPAISRIIAASLDVHFTKTTDDKIIFKGEDDKAFKKLFEALETKLENETFISKNSVRKTIRELFPSDNSETDDFKAEFSAAASAITGNVAANQNARTPAQGSVRGTFSARSEKQKLQAQLIDDNDFVFSVGPAGTGKTHVAMIKAVEALKSGKVKRIMLARPAQEAGENLGFLPGTANDKIAPYMRPLYDELDKVFGKGAYKKMIENETLEVAPIGYMRGRTFEDCFVLVDEAQNCEYEQLQMAVTRLGPGSKMVITGDPDQVDLKFPKVSGLVTMLDEVADIEGWAVQKYDAKDVVRHPSVQRFLEKKEEMKRQSLSNKPNSTQKPQVK